MTSTNATSADAASTDTASTDATSTEPFTNMVMLMLVVTCCTSTYTILNLTL